MRPLRRPLVRSISALVAATSLALVGVSAAAAAPDPPRAIDAGDVLMLGQTPHLWIVDGQAVAHFVGDPRALADRRVEWDTSRAFTAAELGAVARGEPWLSAALVRIGDAIYVPGYAGPGGPPTLYRVQSPADLAFLGVDAANYDRLVLDRAAWEQRYGFATDGLTTGELLLAPAPAPAPAPAASTEPFDDTGTFSATA
jgi:hypothetical protein